ncbi:hypothetical protein ACB092_01G198400 [Castanea dentata]
MYVDFFKFGCMNILGLVLKFWEVLVTCIRGFSISGPSVNITSSRPSKRSLQVWHMVIDNLTIVDMSLDPWLGCEE